MPSKKDLASAAFAAMAAALAPAALAASDVFRIPVTDGLSWVFETTETTQDSNGQSGVDGPYREAIVFSAIDRRIVDHQAAFQVSNGWFLADTPDGYFIVAQGDPDAGGEYDYFPDPKPFMPAAPLEVGVDAHYSGNSRGQWAVPGGGFETWSGTWSETLTNLGHESVTTPLGTFDAAKLRVVSSSTVDSRSLFPNASETAHWTEYRWFAAGVGFVKVEGSGGSEIDFNGDSVTDFWQTETVSMIAIPEPGTAWLFAAGITIGVLRVRLRPVRGRD